jgi:hypothetical protein
MYKMYRKAVVLLALAPSLAWTQWSGHAHDPQHTGTSTVAAQALNSIHWQTPMDLSGEGEPQGISGPLFVHYGSPLVTTSNTVIVPVTDASGNYTLEAFSSTTGMLKYVLTSCISLGCYTPPALSWIAPYGPALSLGARLYYAGPGGTVFYRTNPDSATGSVAQLAFYGMAGANGYTSNQAAFNGAVTISTPITADRSGNVYFGYEVTGANPAGLAIGGGIARISLTGAAKFASAQSLTGDSYVAFNCAPALSIDQGTLYVATSSGGDYGTGHLVSLNAASLGLKNFVALNDPRAGYGSATVGAISSATPTVGPDGDVYFGVLEGLCCFSHHFRGWLLHFDSSLTTTKTPGSFGWDSTPSVVPSGAVPSYAGTSSYLIVTKYNNYEGAGGDGVNKVAVLDPNASQQDEYSNVPMNVMQEVITVTGATSDGGNGFREWCINTIAVDPITKAAIVNSEDGTVYRWDFTSNSLLQRVGLTAGRSSAYTPTVIGPDGTVYAVNDQILFAVGQ